MVQNVIDAGLLAVMVKVVQSVLPTSIFIISRYISPHRFIHIQQYQTNHVFKRVKPIRRNHR